MEFGSGCIYFLHIFTNRHVRSQGSVTWFFERNFLIHKIKMGTENFRRTKNRKKTLSIGFKVGGFGIWFYPPPLKKIKQRSKLAKSERNLLPKQNQLRFNLKFDQKKDCFFSAEKFTKSPYEIKVEKKNRINKRPQ